MTSIPDIQKKLNESEKSKKHAVKEVIEIIIKELQNEESVYLKGLGKFVVKLQKERTARNPATGEGVIIPAKTVIKFIPSKNFFKGR